MKKYYVGMFLIGSIFLAQPSADTDAQRNDTFVQPLVVAPSRKTEDQVKEQEAKKQELFKKVLSNQDTVLVLLSKKTKPKIVRVYKPTPIFIPTTPGEDYVLTKHAVSKPVALADTSFDSKTIDTLVNKPKVIKHSFFYRLFHKK